MTLNPGLRYDYMSRPTGGRIAAPPFAAGGASAPRFRVGLLMHTVVLALLAALVATGTPPADSGFEPGARVLLDAHNCYPSDGRWPDRIDRALATGVPLAIEQDLVWYRDASTGEGRSLVAHGQKDLPNLGLSGREPDLRRHFFERIRPLVERELRAGRRENWPIVTLNLDLKTEEPEHLAALWALLVEYRQWLTTAPRAARLEDVRPMSVGPVLVLTGESDLQRAAFHDAVPAGGSLLVFGAARPVVRETRGPAGAGGQPADVMPGRRTNYHRWWNNPWSVVEPGGPRAAGNWSADDERRLRQLVGMSHRAGLWIRFYTLDGLDPADRSNGWSADYNFGSLDAARERWLAASAAGVDFVAVDQYEAFAAELARSRRVPR